MIIAIKAHLLARKPRPTHSKVIASDDNSGYYIDLSKTKSGKPSRNLLAFFVSVIGIASQAVPKYIDTAPPAPISASRGQTIISIANHLLTSYDGLTLQNKIAVRRICRAVAFSTESKTRHPILLPYSVAHTQKLKGDSYHG